MTAKTHTLLTAAMLASAGVSSASLFTEDFDDGAAATRWTTQTSGLGDGTADLAFDYSTLPGGVPSAPNSTGGSTIGLVMQANILGLGAPGAVNVFANGTNFDGTLDNFKMTADVYLVGFTGGGSTETFMGGFGGNAAAANPVTAAIGVPYDDGIGFGFTGEGGASNDVRVFTGDGTLGGVAGADDYEAYGFYGVPTDWELGNVDGISPPFDEGPPVGQWFELEIGVWDEFLYAASNGTLIYFEKVSTDLAGQLWLGHSDEFGSTNTGNYSVFDNIVVEELLTQPYAEIPEPATMALVAVGGIAALRRRR